MSEKRNLPSIQELYDNDNLEIKKNWDSLNVLLNQEPKESWVKKQKDFWFIPIERIEWLLTYTFIKWWPEVRSVQILGNAVQVTVRLHYVEPITNKEYFVDGVGAWPLQTEKGASPTDFSMLKHNAVQLATPAAKSEAIKNAAKHFGRLFGKDLNRDMMSNYNYEGRFDGIELSKKAKEFSNALQLCQDQELKEELMMIALDNEGKETIEMYETLLNRLNGNN